MDASTNAAIAGETLEALRDGRAVVVATVVRAPSASDGLLGAKMLVRDDGSRLGSLGGGPLEEAVVAAALATFTATPRAEVRSLHYNTRGEAVHRLEARPDAAFQVMVELTEPRPVLLIVGAGHIGHSLSKIGSHVGFAVAVLDDRADFARRERFPEAEQVICADLKESLRAFPITPNTSIVLVSRGHKQDELSLREVATSAAGYVGMIGSKRRVTTVLQRLAKEGLPVEALERVRTPIGLDIGAETPEEIAVSIIGEIVQTRRGGTGRRMSELRPARVRPKE